MLGLGLGMGLRLGPGLGLGQAQKLRSSWYRSPAPRGGGHALQGVTGWQNLVWGGGWGLGHELRGSLTCLYRELELCYKHEN